jgi:hypothetical protein
MMFAALVSLSLVTNVAFDPQLVNPRGSAATSRERLSERGKDAVMRPLIRSATACVVHAVAADPRFATSLETGDLANLIVDSMPNCTDAMRAMIDAHDRLFGIGSGEAFFMGPYLDVLPATVSKMVRDSVR